MLARGTRDDLPRLSRVLVADHDPKLRAEMVAILGERCEVIEAVDGAEALEQTAEILLSSGRLPDAFVLDVRLPYLSGIHVMCAVRGCDRYVPIVLTTPADDLWTHSIAVRFGAVLVEKPFDVAALCGAILEVSRDPPPLASSRAYPTRHVRVDRSARS
ncbi:MAG: response regulator [Deltaproteobacteria bacterium]